MEIKVMKALLEDNLEKAKDINSLLNSKKILMVNLISSPGSGKTTLLEKTIEYLNDTYRIAVIEGDITTDRDAQRLKRFNIPIIVINTEGACHLNADSIEKAMTEFDLDNLDIIFVENVGNLVCPAEFNIGEDAKVAVVSVTEGDDKPGKYPLLFREAKLLILNKIDLIPYTNFNKDLFYADLKKINGQLPVVETVGTKSEGLAVWFNWIESKMKNK